MNTLVKAVHQDKSTIPTVGQIAVRAFVNGWEPKTSARVKAEPTAVEDEETITEFWWNRCRWCGMWAQIGGAWWERKCPACGRGGE